MSCCFLDRKRGWTGLPNDRANTISVLSDLDVERWPRSQQGASEMPEGISRAKYAYPLALETGPLAAPGTSMNRHYHNDWWQYAVPAGRMFGRLSIVLDTAVRDAYGWSDLDLGHSVAEVETLPESERTRYTISPSARKELLWKLLALNHQCYATEVAVQLATQAGSRRRLSRRIETGEVLQSAEGVPSIVLPSELRIPAANPVAYLMKFVRLAMQEARGNTRLLDLARAYVLLKHRKVITDLAGEVGGMHGAALKWAQSFNEKIDETQFSNTLTHMWLQRGEIALEGEGREVSVTATVFAALSDSTPGWRRIDAQIACWAVWHLPPAIFDRTDIALVVDKMIVEAAA